MTNTEKHQAALAMEVIAQTAAHIKELALEIHEADNPHHRCHLVGAVERMTEHTGMIADRWAKALGGVKWRGDLDEWTMPPSYFSEAETE